MPPYTVYYTNLRMLVIWFYHLVSRIFILIDIKVKDKSDIFLFTFIIVRFNIRVSILCVFYNSVIFAVCSAWKSISEKLKCFYRHIFSIISALFLGSHDTNQIILAAKTPPKVETSFLVFTLYRLYAIIIYKK